MRRLALACLLLSGCFIDPNKLLDGGINNDGGGSGDDQAAPTGDGGGGNNDSGTLVKKAGSVVIAEFPYVGTSGSSAMPLTVVSAGFFDSVTTPCAQKTVGACTIQKCANTAPSYNATAGNISITGGTPSPLSLSPNGFAYTPIMQNSLAWNATLNLSVNASGGDVPAFSGTVTAPSLITVTAPPRPDQDMLGPPAAVDKAADLQLTWTGGTTGTQVEFLLASVPGDYLVHCDYAGQAGSGTVPSAVLTEMFNDGVETMRVGASAIGSTMITAGEYKVAFLAINNADYTVTLDIE